ncbi:hypothetical protein ACFQ60_15440 [Streptomyces zhihengii]
MGPAGLDDPGLLGPLKAFRARHARIVENGEDDQAADRLARLVRPFLLRRRKSDPGIVPELPPKTETDHPVPSPASRRPSTRPWCARRWRPSRRRRGWHAAAW